LLARPDVVLPLFIKYNTGMNRLGFVEADLAWLNDRLPRLQNSGMTMMTHFADADGPSGIAWQLDNFRRMTDGWQGEVSVCNSAAILRYPAAAASWVRPGIMLYGGSPFADASAASLNLLPAMTLSAELIGVQDLQTGATVGYGRSFKVESAMRVGVVACGYADGYPRHAPTGTPILVDGVRTRTVGRVSMDMLAVDLSALPNARVGSRVTLWGEGLAADEVATAAGTISYELFCALARRVPVSADDAC
jgi:alanine racemase